MANIRNQVKNLWIRGMEAVGNTASNIASNTKYKVDEMNLQNKRRENINSLGAQAYLLWQRGVPFPDEMLSLLNETKEIDEKLNDMRTERYTGNAAENRPDAVSDSEEEGNAAEEGPADESLVSEELEPETETVRMTANAETSAFAEPIDHLFGQEKTIDSLAGKVNDGLENLDRSMKKFEESREQ